MQIDEVPAIYLADRELLLRISEKSRKYNVTFESIVRRAIEEFDFSRIRRPEKLPFEWWGDEKVTLLDFSNVKTLTTWAKKIGTSCVSLLSSILFFNFHPSGERIFHLSQVKYKRTHILGEEFNF